MVKYDEMNSSFIFIDMLEEFSEGFAVSKPCGDKRLFESIYAASKFAPCILIHPDGNSILFNKKDIHHFDIELQKSINANDLQIQILESKENFVNLFN